MAPCIACGQRSIPVSRAIGACAACIRIGSEAALAASEESHRSARLEFRLPTDPPRDPAGLVCDLCARLCRLGEGSRGYCGIRVNREGRLVGGDEQAGRVQWYHDPLPTNCVADWVCPAGTGCGYPTFSYDDGPEYGYKNLAVFYEACSFDCLFCQNWHYRRGSQPAGGTSAEALAAAVDGRTACICYFGGDPGPQAQHALAASRLALKKNPGRILRICWETNGCENPRILDEMLTLSLESGGCVKFDLKAFDEHLHQALCGVTNRRTLDNFQRAARRISERPEPPPLVASTLLVPGYVDVQEVAAIARFISDINPTIPYALLGFHPDFVMHDLPRTSRRHAEEAEKAARAAGLERVRIGNRQVLGEDY